MLLLKITNLFLFLAFTFTLEAQVQIKSIQFGYQLFEMSIIGTTPYTIGYQLIKPQVHLDRLAWVGTEGRRGFSGSGSISTPSQFFVNIELGKDHSLSKFWHKHTIQAGVSLSNLEAQTGMSLDKMLMYDNTTGHVDFQKFLYQFNNYKRFIGCNLGINRRFPIKNYLNFITGFHVQLGAIITNRYEQKVVTYQINTHHSIASTEYLEDFYGYNYTQWHLTIPLGLEATINRFSLRAQVHLGYLEDRYRNTLADKEAHGLQFWLGYILKKPKKK